MDRDEALFSVIPEEEKRCIWMEYGVVSFKLCDHDYQCDTCPFNMAMEVCFGKVSPRIPRKLEVLPSQAWGFEINTSLYHTRHHLWIEPLGGNHFRIGIDGFVARLLSSLEGVVLPDEHESIEEGKRFIELISKEGVFIIPAPADGKVEGINGDILTSPELVLQAPYHQGYLVEMRFDRPGWILRNCKIGHECLKWYLDEIEWIEYRVEEVLSRKGPGRMAADGGTPAGLCKVLPPRIFQEVLSTLLGKPRVSSTDSL